MIFCSVVVVGEYKDGGSAKQITIGIYTNSTQSTKGTQAS